MTLLQKFALIFTVTALSFSSNASASTSVASVYNDKGNMIARIYGIAGNEIYGEQEGVASAASFRLPIGLAIGANNDLYISDTGNHKIRKFSSGYISTYAGPSSSFLRNSEGQPVGTLLDGSKGNALFDAPADITYGTDGSLYVADSGNNAIRKITSSGDIITIAGNGKIGATDGQGAAATFYHPEGIAVTKSGIIYVADTLNHVIRKIKPDGSTSTIGAASSRVVESYPGLVLASGDYRDGPISQAFFNEPTSLALDAKGNLYVSDSGNHRIRYIDFGTNKVTTAAGSIKSEGSSVYGKNELYATGAYKDGPAQSASFHFPKGIALDSAGGLLIADSLNNVIRYLKNGTVTTIAGSQSGESGLQNGLESQALFNSPRDVAITLDGTVYVADMGNNMIRKIVPYQLPVTINRNQPIIKVALENKQVTFDAHPEINGGRVMVPVRKIAEALGFKLTFSSNGQTVSLEKDSRFIQLNLGSKIIKLKEQNGIEKTKETDIAPYVVNNRTFVPLRFFAEEIGIDVQWSSAIQTAILRYK